MKVLKNIFSKLYIYILWVLFAYVLWTFIFGFVTDARPKRKVVAFADVTEIRDLDLDIELEKTKDEGIKMIRIRPFSYAMFSQGAITGADFYIIGVNEAPIYEESFAEIPKETAERLADLYEENTQDFYRSEDGAVYGIKIYDASTKTGPMQSYINYCQSESKEEDYYLFFNKKTIHAKEILGSGDDAAIHTVEQMYKIRD